MSGEDFLHISGLRVAAFIGVPDEERASPQPLEFDLWLQPRQPLHALCDDISRAVDYQAVSVEVVRLVQQRPRHLIETLATEVADGLLASFPLSAVRLELRKFVLPACRHVAVRITRRA